METSSFDRDASRRVASRLYERRRLEMSFRQMRPRVTTFARTYRVTVYARDINLTRGIDHRVSLANATIV